jgi:Spy/CpxP family protein refolding chaperone
MKRWTLPIALYLFVVFVSGSVLGALGYRLYSPPTTKSNAPKLSPEEWRSQHIEEMRQKLNLTADQLQKVNTIYDETHSRFEAAHNTHNQVVKQIREEHVAKVRALLTAEQLPKYEQLRAEREQRGKNQKK